MGEVILDSVFGGLTGVPVAGFVPATLQAGAGAGYDRVVDKKLQKREDLREYFNKFYRSVIDSPITLDGFVETKDESGNVTKVKIEAKDFQEYVNKMLEWNDVTI